MKILISVCGEGFGHTTRCIAVGEELSKKHDIKFVAYGKSRYFILEHGHEVYETYPDIKLFGNNDGKFNIIKSIFNKEYKPIRAILREMKIIKEYNPDLIISDCKYSTVIASKFLKKPYYVITNQNYPRTHKKKMKCIVYLIRKIMGIMNKSAKGVLIPDLPMPYTVCEYNLTNRNDLIFIGPLIRYKLNDYDVKRGDYILSVIGGFEYRFRILELLSKVAEKKNLKVKMVCGSNEVAEKLRKIKNSKNITIIPITMDMEDLIKNCSFIVCHGGHSTLMEALSFGKPVITIPDLDHPEQENNARKINKLKCGIALSHETLNNDLNNAIDEMNNNDIYFKNAEKMSKLCKKYNGRDAISTIIG
jgi:uncharacterized protein (TIGR00661 family)